MVSETPIAELLDAPPAPRAGRIRTASFALAWDPDDAEDSPVAAVQVSRALAEERVLVELRLETGDRVLLSAEASAAALEGLPRLTASGEDVPLRALLDLVFAALHEGAILRRALPVEDAPASAALQGWQPFRNADGRWGFRGDFGALIEPQWRAVRAFHEGRAPVQSSTGSWGFIDETGELVIPLRYQDVGKWRNGMCAVKEDGAWKTLGLPGAKPGADSALPSDQRSWLARPGAKSIACGWLLITFGTAAVTLSATVTAFAMVPGFLLFGLGLSRYFRFRR